jgi:hypothetical protein
MKVELSQHIFENIQISNFTKIRPLEAEFFHADGWLYRQTDRHDEANSGFSKFCEITQKRKTRFIFDIVRRRCVLRSNQNHLEACNFFHCESKLKSIIRYAEAEEKG